MQKSNKDVQQAEAMKQQAQQLEQMLGRMQREPYACLALPDATGRIRIKIEFLGGEKGVHEYAYDAAGRLTGVRRNGQVTEQYAYDAKGRRGIDRCQARSMQERRHEYGPDDRLLRAGVVAFEYDAMGRLERRKEPGRNDFICMYTPLSFLGAARLPDMRWISFDRDGDGRRTSKQIDNKKVEGYGWDRQGRLAWCFDVASGETCWFEYGDKDARLPVSMQRGGQKYMLGWDQVGSLRAVIDGQGRVVKEIEYDAFGNILRETAPELRIPFGFAGGLHDRDTGLVRYRFRDYLPDVGRFTAKDPIGYKGGDADLYGYCLDDPVNGIDPSGLGARWDMFRDGVLSVPKKVYDGIQPLFEQPDDPSEATFSDRMKYWVVKGSKMGRNRGVLGGLLRGNPLQDSLLAVLAPYWASVVVYWEAWWQRQRHMEMSCIHYRGMLMIRYQIFYHSTMIDSDMILQNKTNIPCAYCNTNMRKESTTLVGSIEVFVGILLFVETVYFPDLITLLFTVIFIVVGVVTLFRKKKVYYCRNCKKRISS